MRSPVDRRGTHPQQVGGGAASVPAYLQGKVGKALAGTRCTTPPATLLQGRWVTTGGCTHPGNKGCERAPAPVQRIGCLMRPTYLLHELGTAKNPKALSEAPSPMTFQYDRHALMETGEQFVLRRFANGKSQWAIKTLWTNRPVLKFHWLCGGIRFCDRSESFVLRLGCTRFRGPLCLGG